MNRKECEGCRYYRVLYTAGNWTPPKVCNFCHDTGEPRGCPAGKDCKRYTPGKVGRMEQLPVVWRRNHDH